MASKQTPMHAQDPRSEQRTAATEPVLLSTLEQPTSVETTRTQNISSRGARVMTQRIWQPGSEVVIRCPRGNLWAQARVIYWRSFSSSRFAIGLHFLAKTGDWPASPPAD
jgi:hypothetical protein